MPPSVFFRVACDSNSSRDFIFGKSRLEFLKKSNRDLIFEIFQIATRFSRNLSRDSNWEENQVATRLNVRHQQVSVKKKYLKAVLKELNERTNGLRELLKFYDITHKRQGRDVVKKTMQNWSTSYVLPTKSRCGPGAWRAHISDVCGW